MERSSVSRRDARWTACGWHTRSGQSLCSAVIRRRTSVLNLSHPLKIDAISKLEAEQSQHPSSHPMKTLKDPVGRGPSRKMFVSLVTDHGWEFRDAWRQAPAASRRNLFQGDVDCAP